jgi:hypothetical protein
MKNEQLKELQFPTRTDLQLIAQESDTITIPPGVHIANPNIRRTRIIDASTGHTFTVNLF